MVFRSSTLLLTMPRSILSLPLSQSTDAMERDMASLESLLRLAPEQLNGAVTEWLENMHTQRDCPALVTELQLHARRSSEFAEQYYSLQERQIQMLASILKRYFKALSKDLRSEERRVG